MGFCGVQEVVRGVPPNLFSPGFDLGDGRPWLRLDHQHINLDLARFNKSLISPKLYVTMSCMPFPVPIIFNIRFRLKYPG